jgi:predicted ATP-dependent serine protease
VTDAPDSVEQPPFYYAEESQQNKFNCRECNCVVDIRGWFGYCSCCGTRNDLQELELKTLATIRERINTQEVREDCVRDAVAAFDLFIGQYVKQLVNRVPMTQTQTNRLEMPGF